MFWNQGLGGRKPDSAGRPGGIHIHPHRVHAILDHRVEAAGQLALADVVLVLADTYALGSILTSSASGSWGGERWRRRHEWNTSRSGNSGRASSGG